MDEQALEFLRQRDRLDDLPSPATDRRRAVDEKGDVAAESRGEFGQLARRRNRSPVSSRKASSTAAASLLPPPSPAPTGTAFSR